MKEELHVFVLFILETLNGFRSLLYNILEHLKEARQDTVFVLFASRDFKNRSVLGNFTEFKHKLVDGLNLI